jgi:hypothetical protein
VAEKAAHKKSVCAAPMLSEFQSIQGVRECGRGFTGEDSMKRFATVGMLALIALSACGKEELKAARNRIEELEKENASLKTRVDEQTQAVTRVTADRDELKAQVEKAAVAAAPAPAPAPAKAPAKTAAKPAGKKHK